MNLLGASYASKRKVIRPAVSQILRRINGGSTFQQQDLQTRLREDLGRQATAGSGTYYQDIVDLQQGWFSIPKRPAKRIEKSRSLRIRVAVAPG
jgi:hypothetical protein